MGVAKDQEQQAEDSWGRIGHKCAVCAQTVPLSEKDDYFEADMCSRCRQIMQGDD